MIFVSVGTHEQSFKRLLQAVDQLKENGTIKDEVLMQIGYSDYIPKACRWERFLTYDQMESYLSTSSVIICHGGPATFMGAIAKGKIPIVVPRLKAYQEHVNDHQLDFVLKIKEKKQYNLIMIEDVRDLPSALESVQMHPSQPRSGTTNHQFVQKLKQEIESLFGI